MLCAVPEYHLQHSELFATDNTEEVALHFACPDPWLHGVGQRPHADARSWPCAQLMLWSVGLRGAIAFGLVLQLRPAPGPDQPPREGLPAIEAATLVIVVVSTLVFGTATGPLLRHLNLEVHPRNERLFAPMPAVILCRSRVFLRLRVLGTALGLRLCHLWLDTCVRGPRV